MPHARTKQTSRLVFLAVALLALLNGGCLFLAAGAAAGGAAAGYAYVNGRLYRDYPATLPAAAAAVRASLVELQFPLLVEKNESGKPSFESKASDGTTVYVYLETLTSRIPAEGPLTRVSVRVGAFGDEAVSARILDRVSAHLIVPAAAGPMPVASPLAPPAPAQPPETAPPPLAPPVPVPQPGK